MLFLDWTNGGLSEQYYSVRTTTSSTWTWLAVVVLLFVLLLILAFSNSKNRDITTGAVQGVQGLQGSARITPRAVQNARRFRRTMHSVDPTKRIVYSGVTVNLQSNWSGSPYGVIPLTTASAECVKFQVDSGPYTQQPQSVNLSGNAAQNTLEQIAWNNLTSSYLMSDTSDVNAKTPPVVAPLTTTPGWIQFQQCGTSSSSTYWNNLELSSSSTVSYAFPINQSSIITVPAVDLTVTIPTDSFLLRTYFYPTQNPNLSLTSANVMVTGVFNGVYFDSLSPVNLYPNANYNLSAYVPIPTTFTSSDGTTCLTFTQLKNPQLILNAQFTDSTNSNQTTIQQRIDIVQKVYAVPPIGTLIITDVPFFNYSNNPQNVVWLNDAINLYNLPPIPVNGPGKTLYVKPRIMPENAALFSSPAAFTAWKLKYGVVYPTATEHDARYEIFKNNVALASKFNTEQPNALFGATKLADLTLAEVKKYWSGPGGLPRPGAIRSKITKSQFLAGRKRTTGPVPPAWDWRDHNAVTEIKDQNPYGTCWSFGATATMEGQWAQKSGQLVNLSNQQLIDCANSFPDTRHCTAVNSMNYAIMSAMGGGGMMTYAAYPYKGTISVDSTQGFPCQYVQPPSPSTYYAQAVGSMMILPEMVGATPEDALMNYVYEIGPVDVGIDTSNLVQLYVEGVLDPQNCGTNQDHCVCLVGYGVLCGTPYWILKNQWGLDAGVDGYIYLQRQPGNTGSALCGINQGVVAAFYEPTVPSCVLPLSQFSGSLNPDCCNSGIDGYVFNLVDSANNSCQTVTLSIGDFANQALQVTSSNLLSNQDWTNPSAAPSPSFAWAPPVARATNNNATVVFGSCTGSGSTCSNGSMAPVTLTFNGFNYMYVIATSNCSTYSIPVPFVYSINPNTFKARIYIVPDPAYPTVQLANASIGLSGIVNNIQQTTSSPVVTSPLTKYTASDYVDISTILKTTDLSQVSQLSLTVNCYFTNNTPLSITKPIAQRFFYVPPVATVIVTPSFATNSLSIVTLNDAINAYSFGFFDN